MEPFQDSLIRRLGEAAAKTEAELQLTTKEIQNCEAELLRNQQILAKTSTELTVISMIMPLPRSSVQI